MASLRRRPRVAAAAVTILVIVGVIVSAVWVSRPSPIFINIAGSRPDYTIADLIDYADAIALVRPREQVDVHWNSVDGEPWGSTTDFGKRVHIYRDQSYEVLMVVAGNVPQPSVLVRGVGGTIGNVTLAYADHPHVLPGETYLAFLTQEDTPVRGGFERAWTISWQREGLFHHSDNGWTNESGKSISSDLSLLKK